jgi:hypothetical protein
MSRIGYRDPRYYRVQHPRLEPDSSNACTPAANEPSPPPVPPYMRLLTLIDCELFSNGQPTWEGGAEELARELTKEGSQLLTWNGACARLLGRLHHAHPERIARIHHNHAREWLIYCSQASTVTPVTPEPQSA